MPRPTAETYAELQLAVDVFNKELFDGQLPECLITLQRRPRTAGYFSPARFGAKNGQTTDEIALNPELFAIRPIAKVLQTIAHEMVHQWQHHFGSPSRKSYHDREWANKMEAIGLMPSHTGLPGGRKVGQRVTHYPIPGSRFVEVADRLLTDKSFVITWYDRFPPRIPPAQDPLGTAGSDEDDDKVSPTSNALPHTSGWSVPAVHNGLVLGERNLPGTGKPTTDNSNRVRYVCPSCSIKVWGKPGLRLACLECSSQLS